eukprot:16328-Heterococcus_DN1.PRE.1
MCLCQSVAQEAQALGRLEFLRGQVRSAVHAAPLQELSCARSVHSLRSSLSHRQHRASRVLLSVPVALCAAVHAALQHELYAV